LTTDVGGGVLGALPDGRGRLPRAHAPGARTGAPAADGYLREPLGTRQVAARMPAEPFGHPLLPRRARPLVYCLSLPASRSTAAPAPQCRLIGVTMAKLGSGGSSRSSSSPSLASSPPMVRRPVPARSSIFAEPAMISSRALRSMLIVALGSAGVPRRWVRTPFWSLTWWSSPVSVKRQCNVIRRSAARGPSI
jgi:hypothetical protein